MTIKYLHIRSCDADTYEIEGKGGLTVAYTVAPEMGICLHIAQCSFSDQFSRKIGRELAAKRLTEGGPLEVVKFTHPISETIRNWLSDYFDMYIMQDEKGRYISTFTDLDDIEIPMDEDDNEIIFTPEEGILYT